MSDSDHKFGKQHKTNSNNIMITISYEAGATDVAAPAMDGINAMHSISTNASRGKPATANVARAGGLLGKYYHNNDH
jgi:FAD synthase